MAIFYVFIFLGDISSSGIVSCGKMLPYMEAWLYPLVTSPFTILVTSQSHKAVIQVHATSPCYKSMYKTLLLVRTLSSCFKSMLQVPVTHSNYKSLSQVIAISFDYKFY